MITTYRAELDLVSAEEIVDERRDTRLRYLGRWD